MNVPAGNTSEYIGTLTGQHVKVQDGRINVTVRGNFGEIWVPVNAAAEYEPVKVQTEEEKLSELLESHVYNEEQLGEIMLAIGAGISYDKILQMADTKNSAEKMKEIRKKFTKETASD
jgi:hypothetical protein